MEDLGFSLQFRSGTGILANVFRAEFPLTLKIFLVFSATYKEHVNGHAPNRNGTRHKKNKRKNGLHDNAWPDGAVYSAWPSVLGEKL